MRKHIITTIFMGFFLLGNAQVSSNIDTYVTPLVENKDFSGVILIAENDSVIHFKTYGSANLEWEQKNTRNTVFHIASLTKQFTAAALLIAEQKGLLETADPVSKYLQDFPNSDKIKIEHLLSQRSGIPDYNELEGYAKMSLKQSDLDEVINWFKDQPLEFEPGTQYGYSNSNFILAARILEIASGKSYSNFLNEHIFEPLSMTQTGNYSHEDIIPFRATGYDPAPGGLNRAPYYNKSFKLGSGSLYSTAKDLYIWDKTLYTNDILTEASKKKLFKDYGNNYGLGWGVYQTEAGNTFVSHDGKSPGFFAYMKRYFEIEPKTIIILSNINSGIMNNMKSDITNIVFERGFDIYDTYNTEPTPENLQEYTGKYDFPPEYFFQIVEKEGDLYFKWMDTPFLQYLTPVGKDEFLMRSRYDRLKFNRNEKGEIKSVSYKQKVDTTLCPKFQ